MRSCLLIVLFVVACSDARGSKLDAPPAKRNLVCERVAILNAKAECKPELSGEGDIIAHTARVTMKDGDKSATDVCALSAGMVSMVCGPLLFQEKAPAPQAAPSEAAPQAAKPQQVKAKK